MLERQPCYVICYVIITFLPTNTKCSTMRAARGKMNSRCSRVRDVRTCSNLGPICQDGCLGQEKQYVQLLGTNTFLVQVIAALIIILELLHILHVITIITYIYYDYMQ